MTTPLVPEQVTDFLKPETARGKPNEHRAFAMAGIDRFSETWHAVVAYAKAEIERCRNGLEQPGLDGEATALLRGQILALRELISIEENYRQRTSHRK